MTDVDPQKIKLIRYVPGLHAITLHPHTPPYEFNLKTGINRALAVKRTRIQGWTTRKEWYADFSINPDGKIDYSDMVAYSDISRTFVPVGPFLHPVSGLERLHYLRENDEVHPEPKVMAWPTAPEERLPLVEKARNHLVSDLKNQVIGFLAVIHGGDINAAMAAGDTFLKVHEDALNLFRHHGSKDLQEAMTIATDAWLDQDVGGKTARAEILSAINIRTD